MISVPVEFEYDEHKNAWLIIERGVGFPHLIAAIRDGHLIDISKHPNSAKYPHQHIIEVVYQGYVYRMPCLLQDNKAILKTLYRCRKATKQWKKSQ